MPEHAIVGAAPMPSPSRLAGVLRNRRVPLRVRAGLAAMEARRRIRPRPAYPLRYGPGTIFLSHDDYAVDWESLKFVVADHAYRRAAGYVGAVVLDLGAHKGYYGAYVLALGARTVVSFEPEAANVELLERAAASYRANGADWRVRQAAVGAERGEAELHVMGASWGHALHPPDTFAEYEVGVQRVPIEAMGDILAEAGSLAEDGAPLVVKVNVEGEECAIVLGTPAAAWARVDELFVEMHPWAECGPADLAQHVAAAGLREAPSAMARVLRLVGTSRRP
jgi:FkbM family methyltransferase